MGVLNAEFCMASAARCHGESSPAGVAPAVPWASIQACKPTPVRPAPCTPGLMAPAALKAFTACMAIAAFCQGEGMFGVGIVPAIAPNEGCGDRFPPIRSIPPPMPMPPPMPIPPPMPMPKPMPPPTPIPSWRG